MTGSSHASVNTLTLHGRPGTTVLRVLPFLALVVSGPAIAAEVPEFSIDSVLASLRETHPEASRVADELPAGVSAHENVVYASREGQSLRLDLYRPSNDNELPAVLLIHGGGWVAGDRTMERPFAKRLAARGFVTVPVSYRLGVEGRFPAPVHDLKEAVRWLRAHADEYGIDRDRIGAIGASAGGTLAVTLGVTNGLANLEGDGGSKGFSSAVQAVVDIDGTVTFLDNALIENAETVPSPYWEYVHGTYSESRAVWLAASPLYLVSRTSAPTLFIKSTALQPVLVGRDEMAGRLKLLGVDAVVIQFPDTPHTFWLVHPWFDRTVEETAAFLRKRLRYGKSVREARVGGGMKPMTTDEESLRSLSDSSSTKANRLVVDEG